MIYLSGKSSCPSKHPYKYSLFGTRMCLKGSESLTFEGKIGKNWSLKEFFTYMFMFTSYKFPDDKFLGKMLSFEAKKGRFFFLILQVFCQLLVSIPEWFQLKPSLVASSFQSSSRWRSLSHPAAEVSAWKVTFFITRSLICPQTVVQDS